MYKEHKHCRSMEAHGRGHGRGQHRQGRGRCRERAAFSSERGMRSRQGPRHRGRGFGASWDDEAGTERFGPPPWSPFRQSQDEEEVMVADDIFGPPPWAGKGCCQEQEETETREARLSSRRARLEAWKERLEARLSEIDRALDQLDESAGLSA